MALRTLAERLCTSEEEKKKLVFAKDELRVKLMVMEEEKEARTSSRDDSRQMVELTRRAEELEAAKDHFGKENATLAAAVSEEKRINRVMSAEIAFLKAKLVNRKDDEASKPEDGCKATISSASTAPTAQATTAAAETPRSTARRPLATVHPNSEIKCGNGCKSPPSITYQTTLKDDQEQRTPVSKSAFPSVTGAGSLRCKAEVPPSIVYSPLSDAPFDRSCSLTTAPLKVESSVQNNASTSHDYKNKAISPLVGSPVQQATPAPRRYSARIAAKSGRGAAPPPRRFSARIAAKTSRDSAATGQGFVATRRTRRVEDESSLSSLRVTRSASRAAEKAAIAADKRYESGLYGVSIG